MALSSQVALVLVHGGASSSRMYSRMKPVLRDIYHYEHIYTLDLPGHGKEHDKGPFSFEKSTNALLNLVQSIRTSNDKLFIIIVGISLGGQAVLDLIARHPSAVDSAVISGASIKPPDASASWSMPRLPTDDQNWMKIIMEDAGMLSTEEAQGLQNQSFDFTFTPDPSMNTSTSILILRGAQDTEMACRDFTELTRRASLYSSSDHTKGIVLEGAWHNHPIDIPSEFAELINIWSMLVCADMALQKFAKKSQADDSH